jgi:insecticidal toxin complex protein TccC
MPYDNDIIPLNKTLPLEEQVEEDDSFEEQPFSIRDRFNAEKGDLVYGLSGERGNYLSSAIGQTFRPEDKQMPASIIDMYNNTIALQTNMALLDGPLMKFVKSPEKNMKKMLPPDDIKARSQNVRNYPLWESYFAVGESKIKFNMQEIYKETRKKYGSSPYHQWHISGGDSVPKLLWKRGSKLGLEMAAQGTGNHIHFVLDGLDIPSIVRKEGAGGQSITASELRYAYRNKERLKGKIFFYQNNVQVAAPWESDPELWSQYTLTPKGSEPQPVRERRLNQLYSSIRRALKR